jgi:hypothetical protein
VLATRAASWYRRRSTQEIVDLPAHDRLRVLLGDPTTVPEEC